MGITNNSNPFRDKLHQWNTNKNDGGLTLGELKKAVDPDGFGQYKTQDGLKKSGLSEADAIRIEMLIEEKGDIPDSTVLFADEEIGHLQMKLNESNANKNDKGLTLGELKKAVDSDNNGVDKKDLTKAGMTNKDANTVISKLAKSGKSDSSVIFNNLELDHLALPGTSNEISMKDVKQSPIRANCYFMAALGGVADSRPELINDLIEKKSNGDYHVTFPGKEGTFIVTPSDLSAYYAPITGDNGSKWSEIVQVAFDKASEGRWNMVTVLADTFKDNRDRDSDFGYISEGIEALTGNNVDHDFIGNYLFSSSLLDKIDKSLDKDKIVVASTFQKGNLYADKGEFFTNDTHVYTVVGVDKNKKTVTIRDPYGHVKRGAEDVSTSKKVDEFMTGGWFSDKSKTTTDTSTNGVVELPVDEFMQYFYNIGFETDKKI